jgi:uncharacterized protein with ParB-like and HNH nuclease domain
MNTKIPISQVPQADELSKVIMAVEAVDNGCKTDLQIADYIGFSDRQGRYYRLAAEILNLLENQNNSASLTDEGKDLIVLDDENRIRKIRTILKENLLFKKILNRIEQSDNGLIRAQIIDFLTELIEGSESTITRRYSTIINWLLSSSLLKLDIRELDEEGEKETVYKINDLIDETDFVDNVDAYESIYPVNYSKEIDIKEDRFTVFELIRKIKAGKVIMNPEFQRKLVWKQQQKSQFIESIILNVPLPPFYFKKDLDGKFIIVDGLQRTSTLQSFLSNEFSLQGLNALPQLNGYYFEDLDEALRTRIEDKNMLIYLVQPSVPMVVVYDIFNRINTGGTQLERQEIRNCIFIGESTRLLQRLSSREEFKRAIDYGIADARMKDREAILRCIAFTIMDYQLEYNNSMDEFLENAMKKLNKMSSNEIHYIENDFIKIMKLTYDSFGKKNFRLPTEFSRGRINIAVMETIYYFYWKNMNIVTINKDRILKNYSILMNDDEYNDSVRYSTGSSTKVKTRFNRAIELLGNL